MHRDFPLQQHAYARLAARYANAAGQLGQYGLVVNRIFSTQGIWSLNGDIDAQVAAVMPRDLMQKVRGLVNDPKLDDTAAADMEMAREDHINQTPSLVIVAKGKRQLIAGIPPFSLLKSYLDELLK